MKQRQYREDKMSINLECFEVELYQTPTEVSYACYFADAKRQIPNGWQTILEKYLEWLASCWSDSEDDRLLFEEHRQKLLDAAVHQGYLTFGIG